MRSLIDALHQQGCEAVIPSRRTNHHPRTIDRHLYKERHLIETFFNKIKEYRKLYVWLLHLSGFDKRFADTP